MKHKALLILLVTLCLGLDAGAGEGAKSHKYAVADLRLGKGMIIEGEKVVWEFPIKTATDISIVDGGKILLAGAARMVLLGKDKKILFDCRKPNLFSGFVTSTGSLLVNSGNEFGVFEFAPDGTKIRFISTRIKQSKIKGHYHALHIRESTQGSFWVAHRHNRIARKYDRSGKVLRTIKMPSSVTSVVELPTGNVLVSSGRPGPALVVELDPQDKRVWELKAGDVPKANLMTPCGVVRLSNGNTVITNWTGHNYKGVYLPIFEVTPGKEIVWSADPKTVPEPVAIQILDD